MIKESYIKTVLPNNQFIDIKPDFYHKTTYIQKSEVTDEKILLILPCNSGARFGNYFLGGTYPYMKNNWRKCDIWLRNIRSDIYFSAHSSVEFYFPDGNGAIVFEHENTRVCSSDDKGVPIQHEFTYDDIDGKFSIRKMVDDLKIGFNRAKEYGFTKIISILTPLAYKTTFVKAVDELDMWDMVTMIDSRVGTVDYFMKFINMLLIHDITGILYKDTYSYTYHLKTPIPEEFKFNTHAKYINVDTFSTDRKMVGHKFNHNLPIHNDDLDKSIEELIDLYRLPYNSRLYAF